MGCAGSKSVDIQAGATAAANAAAVNGTQAAQASAVQQGNYIPT